MSGWAQATSLLGDGSLEAALTVAVLLGLRHAMDPDHLTAVATLTVSDPEAGARRAGVLGLAWGLGHGVILFLFGLPLVFLGRTLPEVVHQGAEVMVGVVIVLLAVRLLVRWRRGYFHVHAHDHDGVHHSHPHYHVQVRAGPHPGAHRHAHRVGTDRSPAGAFAVGLVHGVAGSAGVGVLLVAALSTPVMAATALAAFAAAAAAAMAVASAAVGQLLVTGRQEFAGLAHRAVPVFGVVSAGIGIWYSLGAVGLAPLWH